MVYFGDYPIWFNLAQSAGAPVKPIVGLNPQPTVYFLQAVTKGARSPNIAKIVLAYMATSEAQNLIYELVQYGSPFVPGSPIEKIQQEMESKGAKMVTFGDLEEDERRNREYNKLLGF
jgi:ABC-type Fe3+ transport system substrate-binding protein